LKEDEELAKSRNPEGRKVKSGEINVETEKAAKVSHKLAIFIQAFKLLINFLLKTC
jgi:hypothetical protein